MSKKFKFTKQQNDAIVFLTESIKAKEKTVALIGAGGCGKTSIIHELTNVKELKDKSITFTATTNKAAGIMRKDIPTAITMHSAISKFIPTKLYVDLENYFESDGFLDDGQPIELEKETITFLDLKEQKLNDLLSDHDGVDEFFRHNDIDGYDPIVFSHYATSPYIGGVVVVDEASMLPEKSIYKKDDFGVMKLQTIGLDILTEIYDTVILVGDDSQLPPINGKSSFEGIPSFELTENHRSEKDLLRLLQYARDGKPLEFFKPLKGEKIRVLRRLPDKYIKASKDISLNIAHIVYRNKTRQKLTRLIRGSNSAPNENEPIVYCGKNINDEKNNDFIAKNEIGKYSKGMGHWEYHDEFIDFALFDEYESNRSYSKYRYGYALTAHSAQGSSFENVIIHLYDIPGFIDLKTQVQWIYTAVSRAEKSVTIVMGE